MKLNLKKVVCMMSACVMIGTQLLEVSAAELYETQQEIHIEETAQEETAQEETAQEETAQEETTQEVIEAGKETSEDTVQDEQEEQEEQVVLKYVAHVANIGWQSEMHAGEQAGTTGRNLSMEALKVQVQGVEGLGVSYEAHVAEVGWQTSVSDGAIAGTTGRALAMEGIKIWLTGDRAEDYDIYYRTHIANIGWLGWAKNGESAGSQGYAYAMQAIEILILPKDSGEAPVSDDDAFYKKLRVYQRAHVQNIGWMNETETGNILGTTGKNLNMEALQLTTNNASGIQIKYRAHVADIGWQEYVASGELAGTTGRNKAIEAVNIQLTGTNASKYDIYYRAHVTNVGWLDWAKNGEAAGSTGLAYSLQALQIVVVNKGTAAPGSTNKPFVDQSDMRKTFLWPVPDSKRITSYFGLREQPTQGASRDHKGIDIGASKGSRILAVQAGTVIASGYNSSRGNYIEIDHGNDIVTIYMHMDKLNVWKGMTVTRGQKIGEVGSTGISTGPHLHLSFVVDGKYVDPLLYVKP